MSEFDPQPTWASVPSTMGPPAFCQALAGRAVQVEGREALLGVAAVEVEVRVDQGVEQGTVLGAQCALVGEPLGQRPALRARPGAKGGDQLIAGDQAVLKGKQSEEQVARGVVASRHRFGSRSPVGAATCADDLRCDVMDAARRGRHS
jgi:hypothetical protein